MIESVIHMSPFALHVTITANFKVFLEVNHERVGHVRVCAVYMCVQGWLKIPKTWTVTQGGMCERVAPRRA